MCSGGTADRESSECLNADRKATFEAIEIDLLDKASTSGNLNDPS